MKAQIFNGETKRTCEFEEYSRERGEMTSCGKPGYGKIKGAVLCEEHFLFVRKNLSIPKEDVRRVAPA